PIALLADGISEKPEGIGGAPRIPERAMQGEPLFGSNPRSRNIANPGLEIGRRVERFRAGRRRTRVGAEPLLETTPAFHDVALEHPEVPDRGWQAQGKLTFA